MAFFVAPMTYLEELIEKRRTLLSDVAESGGMLSTTVDGMTVTVDWKSLLATYNDEIERESMRQCVGLPVMRSKGRIARAAMTATLVAADGKNAARSRAAEPTAAQPNQRPLRRRSAERRKWSVLVCRRWTVGSCSELSCGS